MVVRRRGSYVLQIAGSLMAVRLSALRAGRPVPPRTIPGIQFCQRQSVLLAAPMHQSPPPESESELELLYD
jgi:hypothetical protein